MCSHLGISHFHSPIPCLTKARFYVEIMCFLKLRMKMDHSFQQNLTFLVKWKGNTTGRASSNLPRSHSCNAGFFPPYLSSARVLITLVCVCARLNLSQCGQQLTLFLKFFNSLLCCVSTLDAGIHQRLLGSFFWCSKNCNRVLLKNNKKKEAGAKLLK